MSAGDGRRAACAIALAAIALTPGPARAGAAAPRRIVILALDGTTLSDWSTANLPSLGAVLRGGALALLSTRTDADPGAAFDVHRIAALTTLRAGARAAVPPVPPYEGGLGPWLAAQGAPLVVVGTEDPRGEEPRNLGDALGTPAVEPVEARSDPSFPGGLRADFGALARAVEAVLPRYPVVYVDPGDTARVEREVGPDPALREAWMRLSMRRADRLVGRLRALLGADGLLLVISAVPPRSRLEERIHLGAIAAVGAGLPAGRLTSGTTRREGVVSLEDVAPTVLDRLAMRAPPGMEGRPAKARAGTGSLAALSSLERDLVHAFRSRRPLTRGMNLAGAAAVLLALATVAAGRGRAGAGRLPRGWRDGLATLLLAVCAAPLALFLEPLLPTDTTRAAAAAAAGLALAAALVARLALGRQAAFLGVMGATAVVLLVDLAAGTPLALRSPLGFQVAGGGRFFGIDEGTMGVLVGALVLAAGLALDRARDPRRLAPWAAGAFALAVVLMASPSFGSKFGATFTAIPAFGILAARTGSGRIDRVALLGIAIATVFATATFAAWDALREPEVQTHIGRAVAGTSETGPVIADKLAAAVRITFRTIWLPSFVVFAGSVGLLAWRRGATLARALWGRPHLRAALWATLVASAAALVSNDTGIIAAAPIAMLASATLFALILAPE